MKKTKPLVETLQQFVDKNPLSMHVPGHKNGLLSNLPEKLKDALMYDVTELNGLDDFHHPEEAIAEAERLLKEAYKSEASFFLVNGSTVGNLAMLYATCKPGDTVLVQRNAHKSIFHAIELVGLHAIYLSPIWDEQTRTAGAVSYTNIENAIKQHPETKAIILTYPSYYGVVNYELEKQIALAHAHHIPVLVDEAHGAHFKASSHLPVSALDLGADVVIQSAHKTLPAMTMGSFMHIQSEFIRIESVNKYLRMLQSSSPSYMIMASLDDARHYVANYLESDYHSFNEKRKNFIDALNRIPNLEVIESDDPLKLLLRSKKHSGFILKESLEQHGVFPELADIEQVLFVLPLLKQGNSYPFTQLKVKVKDAMLALQHQEATRIDTIPIMSQEEITTTSMTITEVENSEKEWISYTKAIGRISAEMIIPYPPGIPLFIKGEKITVEKLKQLAELKSFNIDFQGTHQLEQNLIRVIK
jgi:arginine/lysine/ornithine decarboxylase